MRNVVQLSLPSNNILLMDRSCQSYSYTILYSAVIKTRGYKYVCNAARRYWVSEKRWTDIRMQLTYVEQRMILSVYARRNE